MLLHIGGFNIFQNDTTFGVWIYKEGKCIATASCNGPLDGKTLMEILYHVQGGRK
ncbi:MAG: hypothetical protein IJX39_00240 [Clostridia bacterium]|nr:hypothetical protein [Clostridia bacterium]